MSSSTRISTTPNVVHFTPSSFFAATTDIQSKTAVNCTGASPSSSAIPKRPPKLMEQRVEMPKSVGPCQRRNSQDCAAGGRAKSGGGQQQSGAKQPAQQRTWQQQAMMVGSASVESTRVSAALFATPQRRNVAHLRREHSVSIVIPSRRTLSANFLRYTPPATFVEGENEVSTHFAGSKFIESPSAKSLPLPPSHWLEGFQQSERQVQQKIVEETATSDTDEEPMPMPNTKAANGIPKQPMEAKMNQQHGPPFIPGNWSPPTASAIASGDKSPSGIRMHPLSLIAAAVISS